MHSEQDSFDRQGFESSWIMNPDEVLTKMTMRKMHETMRVEDVFGMMIAGRWSLTLCL
jgi:hypothetical protein